MVTQAAGGLSSAMDTLSVSTTSVGTSTAALAGPIGVAVAVMGAEITAVVALSKGLFDLAHQTADLQGRMFDLSQQTGVSVETLSGLEFQARKTGGNINTVSQSLVVIQGKMDDAQDATSEAAKTFSDLGITVTDTETTLRGTLRALALMPEGFRQTNTAAELFGRRGGKQMLAILKELKGDIDSVIRALRGMGLGSTAAARQADEFNDSLVDLDTSLLGLKVTIGNEVVPTITFGLKQVDKIIRDNKDGLEAVGVVLKGLTVLIGGPIVGSIQILGLAWKAHQPIINAVKGAYEATAEAMKIIRTGRVPTVDPNAIPAQTGTSRGESGIELLERAGQAWRASRNAMLKPFDLEEIFGLKKTKKVADPGLALLKQLQGELRGLNDATRAEEVAIRLLDGEFKNVSASMKEQILLVARMIDTKRRTIEVERQVEDEKKKEQQRIEDLTAQLIAFGKQQIETLRQLRFGDRGPIQEALEFIRLFEYEGGVIDDLTKSWLRFNGTLIQVEKTRARLRDELGDIGLTPAIAPSGIPEADPNRVFDDRFLGLPPPDRDLDRLQRMRETAEDLGFAFGDVFDSIGRGWESLWASMARTALDIGRQITQDLFRGLIEKLLTGSTGGSRTGGIAGLITGPILGQGIPGCALGGPVEAGMLYRVNERGQEFFKPNVSGQVIPMGQQAQQQSISRLYLVDSERAAFDKGATRREIMKVSKQMRKVGKLIPGF